MDLRKYYITAMQNGLFKYFDNMISLFTITDYSRIEKRPYGLIVRDGYYYYYNQELVETAFDKPIKSDKPLLKYLDKIALEPGDLPNVSDSITTTYGNVYVNAIISNILGNRIPFLTGNLGKRLGELEQMIADDLVDDPQEGESSDPNKITASEHTQVLSDLQTLEVLAPFVVTGGTPRNMVPPKGLKQFKEKLLKKYKDKLDDPIIQVQIIKELQNFDEEWLKDDPSNGIVLSGKLKKVARTKSFLATGNTPNFDDEMSSNFRIKSFSEGAETDPEQLAIINSSIRYGSYARGTLTAIAGTIAKAFMQIFSSITCEDRDCGSKLTRTIHISGDKKKFVGRNILLNGTLTLITKDNIDSLMGSYVEARTPSYCKEKKTEVCRVCGGENLWRFREALTQAGTDLASTIIYDVFFAVLKGSSVISVDLDLEDLFK